MFKKTIATILATMTFMTAAQFSFADTNDIDENIFSSISFLKDERSEKELGQLLTNGKTYEFPIIFTDENGQTQELKDKNLDGYRINLKAMEGKEAISSIDTEKDGSSYNLVVKPKAGWPTEETAVSYSFIVSSRNGKTIAQKDIDFSVGYEKINDNAYQGVNKGEFVNVTQKAPIITTEQFDAMDDLADGSSVTLNNYNWRFDVRVSDQKTLNLINSKNANKTVMNAFPDQEFEFFNFPAGSEFDFTGKMTFDVLDLEEDFGGNFYTYRYYKGVMRKIPATYDKEDGTISFNTSWLGNFVVTNVEIADGTVVEDVKGADTIDKDNGNQTTPDKTVPTGAIA